MMRTSTGRGTIGGVTGRIFGSFAAWCIAPITVLSVGVSGIEAALLAPRNEPGKVLVERVSTMVPFPRGLAIVQGDLYVLCRGRVRGAGGVTAEIDDQAGAIYIVDPHISEPAANPEVSEAVRTNGRLLARPTSPPFILWDRSSDPPESDRLTDRPYCTLRYHAPSGNLFICAFSGIDKPRTDADPVAFSKNRTDAVLRFDLRTQSWHEVERHDPAAGPRYPHHDRYRNDPPHGWLEGPDNCLALGRWLYVVSKDNSLLVRYDLGEIERDPEAGPPPSEIVIDHLLPLRDGAKRAYYGHSALAYRDGWLYLGFRTSSIIVRFRVDEEFNPVYPMRAEVVARFDPFDPVRRTSANITDMGFDEAGRLYVVSAQPARIFRFLPDPERVFDGRRGEAAPWVDLAAATGNSAMKSENLLYHDGWLYVTSGDGYDYQAGADGTIYRIRVDD